MANAEQFIMDFVNPHGSTPSLTGTNRANSVRQSHEECCCCFSVIAPYRKFHRRDRAFTLIELMAVVLVILLLAGIMLGAVGYIQRRIAVQTTRAQIAAIETALEAYKSDRGYYPKTRLDRISNLGVTESSNNWYLYRALVGQCAGCKKYLNISTKQILTNIITVLPNICDTWGTALNYYNSPTTPYSVVNTNVGGYAGADWYGGYTCGGQVNVAGYDLFSYGPDKYTYVPGAVDNRADSNALNRAWMNWGQMGYVWSNQVGALDDITNWKP